MKTEFVTYEQALVLKELGIDTSEVFGLVSKDNEYSGDPLLITSDYWTEAPLKQQAFRFFRDNYNILANVYSNASGWLFEYHDNVGGTHRLDSYYSGPNDGGCWDSFEDAETACIDKIIKRIEGGIEKKCAILKEK